MVVEFSVDNAFENEDLETELLQLRMIVEEKSEELEKRNFLLVRARDAIEVLRSDLQAAKENNSQKSSGILEQVDEYKLQIRRLEEQLQEKQQECDELNQKILALEKRMDQYLQQDYQAQRDSFLEASDNHELTKKKCRLLEFDLQNLRDVMDENSNNYEKKIRNLESELQKQQEKFDEESGNNEVIKQKYRQLESELQNSQAINNDKNGKIEYLEKKNLQTSQEIDVLQHKLNTLEFQYNEKMEREKNFMNENSNNYEKKIWNLESDLQKQREKCNEGSDNYETLKQQYRLLESELQSSQTINNERNGKIEFLEKKSLQASKEFDILQHKLNTLEHQYTEKTEREKNVMDENSNNYEKKIRNLESELQKLQEKCNEESNKYEAIKQKHYLLESELRSTQTLSSDRNGKIEFLEKKNLQASKEIDMLQHKLNTLEYQYNEKIEREKNVIDENSNNYEKKIRNLESELQKQREKCNEESGNYESIKQKYRLLESELQSTQAISSDRNGKIELLEKKNLQASKEIDILQHTLNTLEQYNEKMEKEKNERLQNSVKSMEDEYQISMTAWISKFETEANKAKVRMTEEREHAQRAVHAERLRADKLLKECNRVMMEVNSVKVR